MVDDFLIPLGVLFLLLYLGLVLAMVVNGAIEYHDGVEADSALKRERGTRIARRAPLWPIDLGWLVFCTVTGKDPK